MDDREVQHLQRAFDQMVELAKHMAAAFAKIAETNRAATVRLEKMIEETKQINTELRGLRRGMEPENREFAGCIPPEERERLRLNQVCDLVNPAMLLYRVPTDATTVYDNGVELPIIADFPDPHDLCCAKIPAGYCGIVRGPVGIARLGTAPVGQVTCDGSDIGLKLGTVVCACARGDLPNVTPGEIVELSGQRLMVTEIANSMVFFDSVEPEE